MALIRFENNSAPYLSAGNINHNFDELLGEKIWENSNPSDNFEAKSITLNKSINDFKMYEVYFLNWNGDLNTILTTGKIPISNLTRLITQTAWPTYRNISAVSDNTITFGDCLKYENGTSQTTNSNCIPLYVIGYKNTFK